MLPENILLDNELRSPNNNSGLPRTRGSLCLSPVAASTFLDPKRRSWCGTPTSNNGVFISKRYGELGLFKPRSDFSESNFTQVRNEFQNKGVGEKSPSPSPPLRISTRLPSPPSRSLSRESLISSNGGSEAGSEDSGDTGYGATCDIGLMERIIRSHPIWHLPGIQRAGAFHLLQGKEDGCFVVRQSSQVNTMALSVRLPPDKGPYIEHYLIQSTDGQLSLETSDNRFNDMPSLIHHYANCCDELPVQLLLPKSIRQAKTRQQLMSLGLLGQEFWRYSPVNSNANSPDSELQQHAHPLTTFKNEKPTRPNTLNLLSKIDPNRNIATSEPVVKTPPPPPPRWSKAGTPQNNFTVTTTVTFNVNNSYTDSPKDELNCDKKTSPGNSTKTPLSNVTSPQDSVLSTSSMLSPSSLMSPDNLSPLMVTKGSSGLRHSKRTKVKVSKHYQESDIVDSPTMLYYKSGLGDKISDYEDIWANETPRTRPDILQHTNKVLSPLENDGTKKDPCSTPGSSFRAAMPKVASSPLINEMVLVTKQNSPFYAEPADSWTPSGVTKRTSPKNLQPYYLRHSNPPALHLLSPLGAHGDKNDPNEGTTGFMSSYSVDNLSPKQQGLTGLKKPDVRPVCPPSIRTYTMDSWQVDSGWKFLSNDTSLNMDSSDADYDGNWPNLPNIISSLESYSESDEKNTVQDMISKRFPDIKTSPKAQKETKPSIHHRISAYDNVEDRRVSKSAPSEISEATEFSEPWTEVVPSNMANKTDYNVNQSKKLASIRRPSNKDGRNILFEEEFKNDTAPHTVGTAIGSYTLQLAQDKSTTFAQNIDNFISCTLESKEINPKIVMRNMRQFMSGIKNYLVKHGERNFYKEIERERSKLKSNEFLNLDSILEGVMHTLVITPLKEHLQKLFLDYYTKTGAIRLLADNIMYTNTRPLEELGIKPKIYLPTESVLQSIAQYLQKLQKADSPLRKLDFLFAAMATIFSSVKTGQLTGSGRAVPLGADDLLPLLVWVLVKTNFVAAEIEVEYMWGLLHPSLLSGEAVYYLTTLFSAINVLKNIKENQEENHTAHFKNDSTLKVVVPDELHGSILTKTLPARPHMTTKEVCKIIAHKVKITNPQDYALYRITDGEETMLLDNECPQDFLNLEKHTMLAYKRVDAKIAWPNQDKLNG